MAAILSATDCPPGVACGANPVDGMSCVTV